jgi:peroxiredoxin
MFNERVFAMVQEHKQQVADQYIVKAPWSASAYFALFQTIGGSLLFNPRTNPEDIRLFAAVATSWDSYHEGSPRAQNLHNIALEGMTAVRRAQPSVSDPSQDISNIVVETGSFDISLTDKNGHPRRLHDLKGQVVLLDFHVFAQPESSRRILLLQELYGKYHKSGLEIYQVSLDTDAHLWRQRTDALSWVCVRDEDGLDSRWLGTYNIQQLPEFFLLDREANLIKRSSQITDLEAEIKKLL